jgi:hypothetical protein
MNKKNTEYLLKKYPKLYAQYTWPMQQTAMCWGFPGDGWFKLIDGFSRRITKLDPEGKIQCTQCKEKFAQCRFYINSAPIKIADKVFKLINEMEEKSGHICEECGHKGKIRDDIGWYRTLCERHYKETKFGIKKRIESLKPFKHHKNKRYVK